MHESDVVRVVLADDHDGYRDGLARALHAAEHLRLVGEACDGEHALELIASQRPDVAVLDVRMPGIDGLEVCRELRGRGLPTRVVLLSAIGADGLAGSAVDAGAAAWLGKDRSREHICATIDRVGRAARSG